ncbi:MAG: DUF305 domain-containing protein [Kineosporiaceae bacterium]
MLRRSLAPAWARSARAGALVLVAALALSGCGLFGGESSAPSAASTDGGSANQTDVIFAQQMTVDLEQADQVLRLAAGRATNEEVLTLASAIQATQAEERQTLQTLASGWANVPSVSVTRNAYQIDAATMTQLQTLSGAQFEQIFLTVLVAMQRKTIELAQVEASRGQDAATRALASRVVQSRTAEVDYSLRLLAAS